MRTGRFVTVGLCLVLLASARSTRAGEDTPRRTAAARMPPRLLSGSGSGSGHPSLPGGGKTRCADCHTPEGWHRARFPHERTGFRLEGAHLETACRSCHPTSFEAPVPRTCSGCHRDVHAMEFGQRCEGCHQATSWRTEFTADAHRSTVFPLRGGHATLPCTECHAEARERRYAGVPFPCLKCHTRDYERTAQTSLDHARLGFSTTCFECHDPAGWRGARFPAHDACFTLSKGVHSGIACRSCHTTFLSRGEMGACATGTAACSGCHTHDCRREDARHQGVAGYECRDRSCYACHSAVGRR